MPVHTGIHAGLAIAHSPGQEPEYNLVVGRLDAKAGTEANLAAQLEKLQASLKVALKLPGWGGTAQDGAQLRIREG